MQQNEHEAQQPQPEQAQEQEETRIPPYFYFWTEYIPYFEKLSDQQIAVVMRHIFAFVNGRETGTLEDPACLIVADFMIKSIDNAFRKYRAQCANGKKGGAPKGNKNAAKDKREDFAVDSKRIMYIVSEMLYKEAKEECYDIGNYLSFGQKAQVVSAVYFIECDSFAQIFDTYFDGESRFLRDFLESNGISEACDKLLKCGRNRYEKQKRFKQSFADAYQSTIEKAKTIILFFDGSS